MKQRLLLFLAILALVSAFLACGSTASGTDTGTAVTPNATTIGATPTQAAKTWKVGDLVAIGGWEVQVHSAKTAQGGEFSTLKSGDVYLLIDVTVTNKTGQSQTFSSIGQFSVKDATGQTYTQTIDTDAPNAPDGAVANGSKLRGTLAYEVPSTQKQFELGFLPSYGTSDQATWDLTVK